MSSPAARVDALDLDLFKIVPSQTSDPEKRSLLAVQRAVAKHFGTYRYLEIGSHLGGSLQPHVIDPRCTVIHSVDLRPQIAPDDRSREFVKLFKDNSTARMLENLKAVSEEGVRKIRTYDMDSKDVPRSAITDPVHLAFIDGEHTYAGAVRDFDLCQAVIARDGVILFHDMYIVFPAIVDIMAGLRRQGRSFKAVKLERSILAIFLDPAVAANDPFIKEVGDREAAELRRLQRRLRVKRMLPRFIHDLIKRA